MGLGTRLQGRYLYLYILEEISENICFCTNIICACYMYHNINVHVGVNLNCPVLTLAVNDLILCIRILLRVGGGCGHW
jgi:hypothetical protein